MSAVATYEALVAKGCLCGTDAPQDCPVHKAPGDLRGIGAFMRAGMPLAFPTPATCSICRSDSLIYPNVEIDKPNGTGEFRRTLICPRCSAPALERALRAEVEASGLHRLNDRAVFA